MSSSRLDRRAALRRAAAPSVDLSLMPDAAALHALLDAANRAPSTTSTDAAEPAAPPSAEPTPKARPRPQDTLDAPEPGALPSVPLRFRMKARPLGHRTLQPHDPPTAHGLDTRRAQDSARAAEAFVQAHEVEESPKHGPVRLGDMPTLILFGREDARHEADAEAPRPSPVHPGTAGPEKRGPRAVARTLRPQTQSARPGAGAVTLTPTAEEKRFWDASEDHVDEVPLWACADDQQDLAEAIDPELDRWMANRGRRRFLAGVGVAATMLALVGLAALGVAVMAQPALLGADSAQEMPLERPPPPRPVSPR